MPRPMIDITGQRFGHHQGSDGHFHWLCLCDCGKTAIVSGTKLRTGYTQSCGHWKQDGSHHRTHGESAANETPEHRVWRAMLRRCRSPNATDFERYGARGIKVCERWHSYENFLADMGRRPSDEHSIDRINNDGNYEPGNVKWSTRQEQAQNQRPRQRAARRRTSRQQQA